MPLDRTRGEHIEGLGDDYRLVPLAKWADSALWDAAREHATAAFAKAGAMIAIRFDDQHVLVQEYPQSGQPDGVPRIAFLFHRRVPVSPFKRGNDQHAVFKELFHPVVIRLTPGLKSELVMSGRWQDKVVN